MESSLDIDIEQYTHDNEGDWETFTFNQSVNGTFLQSRRFLNYHPKDRFKDHSLMIFVKDNLVAVVPACEMDNDGIKTFVSHMGSTYGGLVISKAALRLEVICSIVNALDEYLQKQGFKKSVIKPTMSILCAEKDESLLFALSQCGYTEFRELNLYIDYSNYDKDIFNNFSKLKRRQVNKCINSGLQLRELTEACEIEDFHTVLSENLMKFNKKPVHTVNELVDLKMRFPESILFYGAYMDEKLLSGTMVFEFPSVKCAHTQYLAAKNMESNISPMSFIYYSMAKLYAEKNYRYLSWGIATEHNGQGVNWGLMRNKEEFGSLHCINYIYEKYYGMDTN